LSSSQTFGFDLYTIFGDDNDFGFSGNFIESLSASKILNTLEAIRRLFETTLRIFFKFFFNWNAAGYKHNLEDHKEQGEPD